MKRWILFAALVLFAQGAKAANAVYIAQASAGGNTGVDCADAKAASYFNSGANYSATPSGIQIGPDTTVNLCSTWTSASTAVNFLQFQGSGSAGHPIVLLFGTGVTMGAAYFGSTGAIDLNGQSHILINGGTTCGKLAGSTGPDTACNGLIENTLAGSSGQTCPGGACTQNFTAGTRSVLIGNGSGNPVDVEIKNLHLGPTYVRAPVSTTDGGDTYAILIAGGSAAQNIRAHNLIIDHVFKGYLMSLGGGPATIADYEFYNSSISDMCWAAGVGADDSTLIINQVVIHDNEVQNWNNWAPMVSVCHGNGLMWFNGDGVTNFGAGKGICVSGSPCLVYNNYLHGDLSGGILASSPSGFISPEDNNQGGYIFNNLVVNTCTGLSPSRSCGIPLYHLEAGGGGVSFLNNTVDSSNGAPCVLLTPITASDIVENNVGVNCSSFENIRPAVFTITSDYNNAFGIVGALWICDNTGLGPPTCLSLATFQGTPYFQDIHSTTSNPLLVGFYRLSAGSPMRGAGVDLTGLGITALDSDLAGNARPNGSAWDVGAFQFNAAAVGGSGPLPGGKMKPGTKIH